MKKLFLLALVLACGMTLTSCDRERVITKEELPLNAVVYIEKTYTDVGLTYAKKETEGFKTTYKVRLDNGLKIEFDKNGVPIDVDADD